MKSQNKNKIRNNIRDLFIEFQSKLQFFERKYLKTMKIADVTPKELKVLYMIAASNLNSMSELADKLRVTQGTLSTSINCLVRKGYINKTKQTSDRRFINISLTEKSLKAIEYYGLFHYDLIDNLIQNIDEDKNIMIEEILVKLNTIMESKSYKKRFKRNQIKS